MATTWSSNDIVIASVHGDGAIYRSTDGGRTWSPIRRRHIIRGFLSLVFGG